MSIKATYLAAKLAYDNAFAQYDARIATLDVQGAISRTSTLEDLERIELWIKRIATEYNIRELRAELGIAEQCLIDWSLDIACAMRPSLAIDTRVLRGNTHVRAKLIELALTLPE
jgi:hypothetical protein